jgi:cytochrome c oxidase subunit 2
MAPGINRRSLLAAGVALFAGAALGVRRLAYAEERVIPIVARKFVFLPNEIVLKVGEPVVLEFTAPEILMGFNLPGFKLRSDLVPGQVTRLRLTPDRAGSFPFLCDVFCGDGHERMSGTLIVS